MDRNKNTLLKKALSLAIILCALASPIFLNKNVLAYRVSGASMSYSQTNQYNNCTSRTGSRTVFKMSFYLDGEYIDANNCCCNSPGLPNFMTEESGVNPFSQYNTGGDAYDMPDGSIKVVFGASGYNMQDVACYIDEDTYEDTDWEYDSQKTTTKTVDTKEFTVEGDTNLNGVSGAIEKNGTYEVDSEKATANFRHTLYQDPQGLDFSVNVSYNGDGLSGSTSVSNYSNSYIDGTKTNNVALTANDNKTAICQNINYSSKNWTYNMVQQKTTTYYARYREHYRNGYYVDRKKIDSKSDISYGSTYADAGSLRGSSSGSTNNACAYFYRPWNFKVNKVSNNTEEKVVYVGEEIKPSFSIEVIKNETSFPITDIPNATIRFCGGIENQETCTNIYSNQTIHASNGSIDGSTSYGYYSKNNYSVDINDEKTGKITVDDVPAGTKYCTSLSIAPTNSGNGYYSNFNRGSVYSKKNCYIVAKRPLVQVWGGNIVSGGDIKSGSLTKKDFGTFGSWGELAVVASGGIEGFASGASLANGGAKNVSLSNLTALTLANAKISNLGGSFNVSRDGIAMDKKNMFDMIESLYKKLDTLPSEPISEQVYIKSEGDLFIGNNIEYVDVATSLNNMPKLVIYSTGNINIGCEVTRIDAVIIADGTINTCTDHDGKTPDVNAKVRSNQLVINGMVLADELLLNRTYGAAIGQEYSAIPAEIINYDPLFELTTIKKETDDSARLNVVYTQESAIRY